MKFEKTMFWLAVALVLINMGYTSYDYFRETPPQPSARMDKESTTAPSEKQDDLIFICLQALEGGDSSSRIGPNGELGPFQITRAFFIDSGVEGEWEQVRNRDFSIKVIKAYWKRWNAHLLQDQIRMFHGGPRGFAKDSTKEYWERFRNLYNTL